MSGFNPVTAHQTIEFSADESDRTVEVYSENVTVVPSPGTHDQGSSSVKLNNIVNFCWEKRFHMGQLLAVHMEGKFIACCIKAGTVRIVNRESAKRCLLKNGMNGMIEDLAFARIPTQVILASVDHLGTLLVHQIAETDSEITCTLLLHVLQNKDVPIGVAHRVFWCSYIPEEDNGQDAYYDEISRLLAVTRNNKIEMWNVGIVSDSQGTGPFVAGDVEEGFLEIAAHSQLIVDAAFSPDGTAIATASLDGVCKFYQVYMHTEEEPRCLHQWEPHGGQPLSALFFLDDHRNHNPDVQFWKFAVTGALGNTEIKLWSCETWKCLQTIRFSSPTAVANLKAAMDLSAGYILMSDLYLRLLYVLQLQKDNNETYPFVCSITEFKLPCPIISFGIVDAGVRIFKPNTSFSLEDICTEGDEDNPGAVVIRMYIVQPKSLQECHIVFQTPTHHAPPLSVITHDSLIYQDELSDLSNSLCTSMEISNPLADGALPTNHNSLQINLMTPDAFNSPVKHTSPVMNRGDSATPVVDSNATSFNTAIISPTNDSTAVMCFTSGGSSPSREVQEILSLQESPTYYVESQNPEVAVNQVAPANKNWPIGLRINECPDLTVEKSPEIPNKNWPIGLRINECSDLPAEKSPEMTNKLPTISVGSGPDGDSTTNKSAEILEGTLSSVRMDVATLILTVQEQSKQIQDLAEELKRKDERQQAMYDELQQRLWQALRQKEEEEPTAATCSLDQSSLAAALSQSVSNAITSTITAEINKVISPAVLSSLSQLKETVSEEVSKKLTTTDQLLKESITKMVRNKSVIETLSNSLLATATPAMTECYKETFKQAVPMFEKACDTMFKQMTATFSKGTEEYVKEIESYSERASARSQEEITAIQTATDTMTHTAQQFATNIERAGKKLEETIVEAVARGLRGGLNNGNVARSRTVTPAPHLMDSHVIQGQLAHLIAQGQFNAAFQQALSAADLSLVMYVCERVAPHQVFTSAGGSVLQQHVLLSLIQQLSADMHHHSEIKHRYLEEAVMNLDPKNTATREHMPAVLAALHKQLQLYISNNPTGSMTKRVRMLQMATQSLLP